MRWAAPHKSCGRVAWPVITTIMTMLTITAMITTITTMGMITTTTMTCRMSMDRAER